MYEFRCEQEETIMELKGSKTEANLQAARVFDSCSLFLIEQESPQAA